MSEEKDPKKKISDKWDKQERDPFHEMISIIKKFSPLLEIWMNKQKTVDVKLRLTPSQLKDLSELVSKWDNEDPKLKEMIDNL